MADVADGVTPRGGARVAQDRRRPHTEDLGDGRLDAGAGALHDRPGNGVDALDVDPGLVEAGADLHGVVQPAQTGGQVVGEVAGEGGQQDARAGVCRGETACTVHRDDGLARPGPTGQPGRLGVVGVDEPLLLGVEEEPPRTEVTRLDDLTELVVVLDPVEGRRRRGVAQALQERLLQPAFLAKPPVVGQTLLPTATLVLGLPMHPSQHSTR